MGLLAASMLTAGLIAVLVPAAGRSAPAEPVSIRIDTPARAALAARRTVGPGRAPARAARSRNDARALDPSFGKRGRVRTSFGTRDGSEGYDLALGPGGDIVVVGDVYLDDDADPIDLAVARYRADGSLDRRFSGDGKAIADIGDCEFTEGGVAIQPDGKIVVATGITQSGCGTNDPVDDIAVVRFLPNGALDPSFGDGGVALTGYGSDDIPLALALQPDGKIIVAGQIGSRNDSDLLVVRFLADGALDAAFGVNGGVRLEVPGGQDGAAVAVQPDGKIVAAGGGTPGPDAQGGADFLVVRFRPDGYPDPEFGRGGGVRTHFGARREFASGIALQADGRMVVGGHSGRTAVRDGDFALARYRPDGSLDPTFGRGGKVITDMGGFDWGEGVAIGPGGKIAVVGWSNPFGPLAVARYRPDGSLDPRFGGDGKVKTWVEGPSDAVAFQPDGKLVVGGSSGAGPTFALARFRATSGGGRDQDRGPRHRRVVPTIRGPMLQEENGARR